MSVATQTTVTGKVSRVVVRPKVIFASIYANDGTKLQFTLFRQNAPSHYADTMMEWEPGQEVTATGNIEPNPFSGEQQLIVSALTGAAPKREEVPISFPVEEVALTQTITITKDTEDFKDQWGRSWFRVPDRF